MTLTDAQCIALAQVLEHLPDNVAAAHITSADAWDVYTDLRDQVIASADDAIHASRAARRG